MIKHKIYVKRRKQGLGMDLVAPQIRRSVRAALDAENVDVPCEVSVLLTDNEGIREINREYRNVDAPTDVLSFPMQELTPGDFRADEAEISPETGLLPLGDIVISAERVYDQADEFGHSTERELSYLVVHSVLHLLGYDHTDEGKMKKKMRAREEEILSGIGLKSR